MSYEQHVCINSSDLVLLENFLHDDVVYYFIRRVYVLSNGKLVVFPKGIIIKIISWLQKSSDRFGKKFYELSFQEKKLLIDELLKNDQLEIVKK